MDHLTVVIDGVPYTVQVGIGAGVGKTIEKLHEGFLTSAAEVTPGSYTELPLAGNTGGETFYYDEASGNSVNSIGLTNHGFMWLLTQIPEMVALAKQYGKKARVSISGTPEQILRMLPRLIEAIAACDGLAWVIVEINMACPNTVDDAGHHHAVVAYDPIAVGYIIAGAYHIVGGRLPLAFKLAPYDKSKLEEVLARERIRSLFCTLTEGYGGEVEIVLCNTRGQTRMLRPDGSPALGVTDGLGGLAGSALFPYTLDNVTAFAGPGDDLPGNISLVAMGGLWSEYPAIIRDRISQILVAGKHLVKKILIATGPYQFGARTVDEVTSALAMLAPDA